jgi:hypothetical protein
VEGAGGCATQRPRWLEACPLIKTVLGAGSPVELHRPVPTVFFASREVAAGMGAGISHANVERWRELTGW